MTIVKRAMRLFKADIHGVMDQLEDKELMLKQYLREMEKNLYAKKSELQHLTKSICHKESGKAACEKEIEKLEADLLLALQKERDEIARVLIRRQRTQQLHRQQINRQLSDLCSEKDRLFNVLKDQRLKYESLQEKAEIFSKQVATSMHCSATDSFFCDSHDTPIVDKDEIELELIRRKESLKKGGQSA